MSDLKEAYKIAEDRTENAIADREKFQDKNREYIHKMQSMKDQLQDKDLQLEEYKAKSSLLQDENKILKDGQEMFQRKFDRIYEDNILIPKNEKGSKNLNAGEGEQQRDQYEQMNNISEEVRKLHLQKSQKDAVIHKLKTYVKKISIENGIDEEEAERELENYLDG